MRIVVENSAYALQNFGDIAMLQVAVRRFQQMWPDAQIDVLTFSEERLQRFCPGTRALLMGPDVVYSATSSGSQTAPAAAPSSRKRLLAAGRKRLTTLKNRLVLDRTDIAFALM